jgi:hypothetical protein
MGDWTDEFNEFELNTTPPAVVLQQMADMEKEKAHVQAVADDLDDRGFAKMTVADALARIHAACPLDQAGMGPDFKSTHSITMDSNGNVCAGIWWGGHVWPITFT